MTAAVEKLLITYVLPYQPLTALSSSGSPPPLPQSTQKAELVKTGAYMVFCGKVRERSTCKACLCTPNLGHKPCPGEDCDIRHMIQARETALVSATGLK